MSHLSEQSVAIPESCRYIALFSRKNMAISLGSIVVLSSLCVALFTVGSFLNAGLLFILIRSRQNRDMISSIYLLSLSIAQAFDSLYEPPYYLVSLCLNLPPPPQERYQLVCKISIFISYFIAAVKIFNLTVMSIDRFLAIIFPFAYERIITKRTASFSVAAAWILPLSATLPLLVMPDWTTYEGGSGYACGVQFQKTGVVYSVVSGLLTVTTPCIIMIITNIKVFLTARHQQRRINSQRVKIGDRSAGTIAFQSQGRELTQRMDACKDGSMSRLDSCNQSSLGHFRQIPCRKYHVQKSNRNSLMPAGNPNYGSKCCGNCSASIAICNQTKPNECAYEDGAIAHIPSTELYVLRGSASSSVIPSSHSNDRCNKKKETASGRLSDGVPLCTSHYLDDTHRLRVIDTSLIDTAKKSSTEGGLRDKGSSTMTHNWRCCGVGASTVHPSLCEEKCNNSSTFLALPLSNATENRGSVESDFDTPLKPRDTSKLSFKKFLKRREKITLMSGTTNDSSISWNIVSSTLLLVLAFCVIYLPFLVTRLVSTIANIELSDEVVTYTAVLTTLGNLINPCIVLTTRQKLKSDFIQLICRRKSSLV